MLEAKKYHIRAKSVDPDLLENANVIFSPRDASGLWPHEFEVGGSRHFGNSIERLSKARPGLEASYFVYSPTLRDFRLSRESWKTKRRKRDMRKGVVSL